jgi:uncharacterized protein
METRQLRVYKIPADDYVIVFVPQLAKVYRTDPQTAARIPDTVAVEQPVLPAPENRAFRHCTLVVTNDCNLHCAYCYGCYGEHHGVRVMPPSIARAAIEKTYRDSEHGRVYLDFFGGEPTLAWDLVASSTGYFRELGTRESRKTTIGITTNGCFSPEKAEWLAANLDSILVSFDGFKSIQDGQRSSSFDLVYRNAKSIYSLAPTKLEFRATISAESVGQLPLIADFFGRQFPGCAQSYEPLFAMGRGSNTTLHSPDSDTFFDKLIESMPIAKQYGSKIRTSILRLKPHSVSFCGAVGTNFMVTYDGRVISCTRMTEDINEASSSFCYGRFDATQGTFAFDSSQHERLRLLATDNIPECHDCYARYNCKGDCPANKAAIDPQNFRTNTSYRCESIRRFIKNILALTVQGGYEGLL